MTIKIPEIDYNKIPGEVIYEVIHGSHSYNLATKKSDVDIKGVYIFSKKDLYFGSREKVIKISDDIVYYELSYFLKLLQKGCTNCFEMLFSDSKYLLKCHYSFMDKIVNKRDKLVNVRYFKSILGFCQSQLNETLKINSENIEEKLLKVKSFKSYCNLVLKNQNTVINLDNISKSKYSGVLSLKNLAFKKINGVDNLYEVYNDFNNIFSKGFLVCENGDIKTSMIPENMTSIGIMFFDKESYKKNAKDNVENWNDFEKKLNSEKFISDIEDKNKIYNPKQLLHSVRLLNVAINYFTTKELTFNNNDRKYLLSIKNGEIPLSQILFIIEQNIKILEDLLKENKIRENISDVFAKYINYSLYSQY